MAEAEFDVIVIGGGITGRSASWFLADEGSGVLCIDDGQGGGSTANAGSLHVQLQSRLERLFPERIDDFERVLPMYPRAVAYWRELAARLDTDIELSTGGGLMVAETAGQIDDLRAKIRRERRQGVDTDLIGRADIDRLAPYLGEAVTAACFCPQEGKVNPLLANRAIRDAAVRSGVRMLDGRGATGLSKHRNHFRVTAAGGEFTAGRVVVAAGAGTGRLIGNGDFVLQTAAEPLHMNITEPVEPFMRHLIQHAGRPITLKQLANGQVVIGGGWRADLDAATGRPAVRLDSLRGNVTLAARLVPGLATVRLLRSWAGINPLVDLISVIGEVDGSAGLFVLVPGDAGYTLGPYCARLLADHMCGRATDFPLAPFRPDRLVRRAVAVPRDRS